MTKMEKIKKLSEDYAEAQLQASKLFEKLRATASDEKEAVVWGENKRSKRAWRVFADESVEVGFRESAARYLRDYFDWRLNNRSMK